MATLATGRGAARIIGLLALPLLTRLYEPHDFGIMAVFTAMIGLLSPFMTLRYPLALPLPRRDGTALNLLALSIGLLLVNIVLVALVLFYLGAPVLTLFSMEPLIPYWWLAIVGILGGNIYEMLTLWATRCRDYRIIARTHVTQSASGSAVKLLFGLVAPGPLGLLIGQIIAKSGGIGSLLLTYGVPIKVGLRDVRRSGIRRTAARYRSFPAYRLPAQFLLTFTLEAPLLFISYHFDASVAGQVALALMIVAVPVSLFSSSIQNVFYAEASQLAKRPVELKNLAQAVVRKLVWMSLIPAVAAMALSPLLFPVLFGAKWELAGWITALFALYMVPQFVSQTLMQVLTITGRNRIYLVFNITRTLIVITTLGIPPILGANVLHTVALYSVGIAIQRCAQAYTVWCILKADCTKSPTENVRE